MIKMTKTARFTSAMLLAANLVAAAIPAQAFDITFDLSVPVERAPNHTSGAGYALHFGGDGVEIDGPKIKGYSDREDVRDGIEDCWRVLEIQSLLRQMYDNLEHYQTIKDKKTRKALIREERAEIKTWERELRKALRKC